MSVSCKFELTRASNIFYSGEVVEGCVILNLLKQRHIEAIILEFYGHTKLAWLDLDKTAVAADQIVHNDFSSKELKSMKTLYNDSQKHVCEQLQLATAEQQLLHPNVDYRYKFRFLIPAYAAATSRCPLGECEYGLQLTLQHPRKVNKEFHQRIVVKNKLDLSRHIQLHEPLTAKHQNDAFGEIALTTPCTGFTPGQKIPYLIKCKTSKSNYKIMVQLNCQITAERRNKTSPYSRRVKQIKQTINFRKHLASEIMSYLNLPLDCQISRGEYVEDALLKYDYLLEALVIDCNKKILAVVSITLTIGTTPCLNTSVDESENLLCYENYGSTNIETATHKIKLNLPIVEGFIGEQIYKSMYGR
ncbi:uncharacterized protein [Musca autumnalis]|uniref:uncharacterized protein n=1 Tax=Musca autumnalis TaxID=221902 RepID=UPI003CEE5D3A